MNFLASKQAGKTPQDADQVLIVATVSVSEGPKNAKSCIFLVSAFLDLSCHAGVAVVKT